MTRNSSLVFGFPESFLSGLFAHELPNLNSVDSTVGLIRV